MASAKEKRDSLNILLSVYNNTRPIELAIKVDKGFVYHSKRVIKERAFIKFKAGLNFDSNVVFHADFFTLDLTYGGVKEKVKIPYKAIFCMRPLRLDNEGIEKIDELLREGIVYPEDFPESLQSFIHNDNLNLLKLISLCGYGVQEG